MAAIGIQMSAQIIGYIHCYRDVILDGLEIVLQWDNRITFVKRPDVY